MSFSRAFILAGKTLAELPALADVLNCSPFFSEFDFDFESEFDF